MSIDLGSAVGSIVLKTDGVTKGVNAAVAALRSFENQTAGAGKNLDKIGESGERAGAQVAKGTQQAEQSIQRLAQSTQNVSGSFDKLAGAAGIAGAALAAGLGVAVKQAADVQTAVARISTIAPDIDTSKVTSELNAMSTRVAQTSTQLAASLNNIFSSIDTNQADALKLTEQFGRGAVAAGTNAETFGTSVLGVMNAYGLAASDASHISDVFFNTIKTGVIDGDQLAKGLGQVTQQAKLAGVNFDTLGALIAGVTREGGDASTNLTNLQNVLNKIATADVQAGLGKLGIQTKDASGNIRDIVAVLGDLDAKLKTLSAADRSKVLQDLFPDSQARAGIATLLSQLDTVKGALRDNAAAAGVADAAYQKMGNTAAAQGQILKNTVTATLSELGAIALPNLVGAAQKIAELVHAFDGLSPSAKNAVVVTAEVVAGFLLIGSAGIKVVSTTIEIAGALKTVGIAAASSAKALATYATSAEAASIATVAIPPVLIALGLAAAGTALAMENMSRGTKEAAAALGGDLGGALAKIDVSKLEALQAFLTGINVAAEKAGKSTAEFAKTQGLDQLRDQIKAAGAEYDKLLSSGKQNTDEAATIRAVIDALFKEIAAREAVIKTGRAQQQQLAALNDQYNGTQVPGEKMAQGFNAGASALAALASAARTSADAIGSTADNTDRLLSKLQVSPAQQFAVQLAQVGSAMSAVSSATAPLSAALDQINAKRAAGLPLTAQENSLLSQIPGYLGAATMATSALVEQQAQLAINSINAQGGISSLANGAGGAASQITALDGAIQALQSHMNALSAENGKLGGEYAILQERVDALNQIEKDGGKLTADQVAERATLLAAEQKIGEQRGINAAKLREDVLADLAATQAVKDRAAAEQAAADARAKQPAVASSAGENRGQLVPPSLTTPPPVPVQLEPAVDNASLAAVRQILGQPVAIPVKVDLQGLGGGAVRGALGIAESMGLSTSGITQAINVTADTSAAETAISAVQQHLAAINATPTLATINAQDNATTPAQAVVEAIKAIPTSHSTELTAVDNASGPIGGVAGAIAAIPASFTVTANVDISGALANIQALSNQIPRSPAKEGPFRQLPNWHALYESLTPAGEDAVLSIQDTTQRMSEAIGDGIDEATATAAKSAAELASTVASAVSATTDALGKLRSFRAPNPAQFLKLRDALVPVIDLFAQDAIARGDGTKAAGDYAEQIGKIVAAVGVGVETLGKLRNFQRPSDRAVSDFRDASQYLVNILVQVARDTDADLTEAGATYADAAGKIYASVGTGVDTLTKLQRFKRPSDKAVTDFRDVSQFLVNVIAQVAADIEDQALPKASDWADTAGKIFSAVGTGVDALTKLQTFERPTDQAVNSFRDVSQYAVNLIAQVAHDIEDQALPKASQWAETALKIFQAIGAGVDGLSKLDSFERPTDQALRSFRDVTQLAVLLIAEAAATISEDALTDAATYADAASKVVGLVGQGVESFAKLATGDLQLPDQARLQAFAAKTAEAVVALAAAAATVDTKAVQAAATYSEGAGKTVALVGQGVEGFAKLATFTAPTAGQIRAFSAAVSATVIAIAQAAKGISADAVKAAGEYSDGAGKAVSLLGSAVGAFKSLGDKDFVLPSKEGIDGVVYLAQYATDRLIGISHSYGNGDLNQLKAFADAASSGFGAIRGALDAGKGLADPDRIKPADAIGEVLAEFQAGLGPLGALATLSQQYKTQGEQIGANIAQAYAAIAAGLPGFTAQSQAATASVSVTSGQTVVHHFDGAIDFRFLGENGQWIVSSLRVDDGALTATSDLIAGKLLPIFEAAVEGAH